MPNFVVVENYSHEHKFNDFKEDYARGLSKTELIKKYDIPKSVWIEWKERMPKRRFYRNQRPKKPKMIRKLRGSFYYVKHPTGNVAVIRKEMDGRDLSYGSYPSMSIAEMVAAELDANDWDIKLAYDLLQEYAVPNSKRTLSGRLLRRINDNAL